MELRQRRLRVIRRLLCLFLFLFLAASSIRKFRYSVKEARHFAAESLIHLAKDLDEEILDVSRFNTNVYNSAQRRSEEDFKEEPEVYERPSSPMPPADPSAPPPPPVAPSMPPPDDAMRRERSDTLTTPSSSSSAINRNLVFFSGSLNEPTVKDHPLYKSNEDDSTDLWAKRRRELFDGSLPHPYVDEDDEDTAHSEQTKRYISLDKILDLKGMRKKYPPYTMEKVELGTERPLHVTFATVELVTLVDNWLTYSVRANIKKIVVVSLDEALHKWCEKELEKRRKHRRESGGDNDDDNDEFACVPGGHLLDKSKLGHSLSGGFREVKESFYALMNVKIQIIETFLLNGYDLLISDADVTWVRDPMPYFNTGNLGKVDIAVSADCVFDFRGDLIDQDEIDLHRKLNFPQLTTTVFTKWEHFRDPFTQLPWPYLAEYNTGMLLLRATLESLRFVKDWKHGMEAGKKLSFANDQHHFNAITRSRWLQRKSLPGYCKKLTDVGEKSSMCRAFDKPTADNRHPDDYFRRPDKTYDPSKPKMTVMDPDFVPRDKEGLCEPVTLDAMKIVKGNANDGFFCEKYPPDFVAFAEDYKRGLRPLYSYGGTSGSLRVAKLPTSLFCNGMVFFMGKDYSKRSIVPYGVHNTYVYDGAQGKIWRFREAGMWADKKPYFLGSSMYNKDLGANHGGSSAKSKVKDPVVVFEEKEEEEEDLSKENDLKTLIVRMSIPDWLEKSVNESITTPKGEIPIGHMNGLRWQLARVRDAVAIAKMLDRALIMPQFICGCHRHFNLLVNCTMGAMTIPFVCPIDHWALPRTFDNLPIPIREASYFENRVNAGFKPFTSPAPRIAICSSDETEDECKNRKGGMRGALPHLPGFAQTQTPIDEGKAKVAIKTGFSSAEFTAKIQSEIKSRGLQDEPVLVLDGLGDFSQSQFVEHGSRTSDFTGFANKDENLAFDDMLGKSTHQWCCYINGTVIHPFPRLHA